MPFYPFEMILVGIILLGAMTVGGIRIWIKRKQDSEKSTLNASLEEKNLDS